MKKHVYQFVLAGALAVLAGCANVADITTGSSSGSGEASPAARGGVRQGPIYKTSQYDVAEIIITVPRTLVVSEANAFHPSADIVWRGEPVGDRYAQVEAVMAEAMAGGTSMMTRGPRVTVEVTVLRFHCLTEKTRYSVGGVHSMQFELTVRDAFGSIIDGPRIVIADAEAAGGAQAIAEDAAGMTQRVVVVQRLARAIRSELSREVSAPGTDLLAEADAPLAEPQYH